MTKKQAIQLFEERKVRTVWDDETVIMKALIFKSPGATALYHIELEINHPG